MKKSLIALAVLAAAGAASAQSTATVYGLADIWFGNVKTDNGAGVTTSTTKLDSGGVNTSRWGLKGSEDLGGGLKANFKLEQGFALDTGLVGTGTAGQVAGTQAFDRQTWVGLSGGFGEVQFGKVWSAYDDVSGASDAMFDSPALAPMNIIFASGGYTDRPINGLRYTSPEMSGFTGAFSYSLDEGVGTSKTALSLSYGAGPLTAQFGYQKEATVAVANDVSFTRLGATYDFHVATAKLTYGKADNIANVSGAGASEWQLGADFPVSAALTLSASYAKSDDNANTITPNQSRKGFGLGAAYTLSKRTFLYGGLTHTSATTAGVDATGDRYAMGIQHKF